MDEAEWGVQLWDCEKEITSRCEDGGAFVHFTRDFVKERARIEQTYARELGKLVESNRKDFKAIQQKVPKDSSTAVAAWESMLHETQGIAKKHDAVAETLVKEVSDPMKILIKSKKAEREAHAKRLSKLQKDADKAEKDYDSKLRAWQKAVKEHAEVVAKAESANRDPSIPPVKLKKLEGEVASLDAKQQMTKADYDLAQATVEQYRRQHYTVELRKVFNDMQKMEMDREQLHAEQLAAYARAFTSVHKTMGQCFDEIAAAAESISWTTDSARFVERTKTGNPPEMRINATVSTKKMVTAQQVNSKRVSKTKIFKTTSRKKDAIREDLGHLTPHQRERALREKVAVMNADRAKEVKAKSGFEKTIEAYTKNPAMGNKKSLDKLHKELEATNKHIAEIDTELVKLSLYLEAYEDQKEQAVEEEDWDDDDDGDGGAAGGGAAAPVPPPAGGAASRGAKTAPPAAAATAAEAAPALPAQLAGAPPHTPKASAPPPPPPAGAAGRKATSQYAFDGSGGTEISLEVNEPVTVTEEDDEGSGWLRVINSKGDEGYVPTSYIK